MTHGEQWQCQQGGVFIIVRHQQGGVIIIVRYQQGGVFTSETSAWLLITDYMLLPLIGDGGSKNQIGQQ